MAYDNPAFRRHEAGHARPSEPGTPIGLGNQSRLRGQAGFREEPDFRGGSEHRSGGEYRSGGESQGGTGYQPAAGYPQGTGYQPGATGYQGGATAYQPGATGYQPGATAYQPAATAYQPGGGAGYGGEEGPTAVSPAELEEVFDEPDAGSGRDRLAVHWLWELLLLVGVGALGFLLWQSQPAALRGGELSLLLTLAAGFGLLGLSAGITLRAGVPNLAIGPVAVAAGVYFAQRGGDGVAISTGTALVVAVVLGAAVALLVVTFHVPGWAASLAGAAAAVVWLQLRPAEIELAGGYDPTGQAAFLFALVAAMGILGGLLGTLRGVRRAVGQWRPVGDPARRRGPMAALVVSGVIVLSMVLAAVAGVLLVAGYGEAIGPGQPVEASSGVTWLTWTVIGFGVALVGGTSAYGRRGGVFGTVLAAVALVLFDRYQFFEGWQIALLATAGVAVAGGLVATRVVEKFGGPRSSGAEPDHDGDSRANAGTGAGPLAGAGIGAGGAGSGSDSGQWETTLPARSVEPPSGRHAEPVAPAAGEGWPAQATDSWSSALPARPATGNTDPWDDDRWSRR